MSPLLLGFTLAALAGILGWRMGALTPGGAWGAALIGTLVFTFGGLTWAGVLLLFFLSSSLLSLAGATRKRGLAAQASQNSRRTLVQTLANGGPGAILAILVGIVTRESPWYPILTLAYFGSLSAVTADTWATELGMLSSQPPRLLSSGEIVSPGRSGGVTPLGLRASLAGGLFIGLSAFVLIQAASLLSSGGWFLRDWFLLPLCLTAGLTGSLFDSWLGATRQRLNFCDVCQQPSEALTHTCGAATRPLRGLPWLNNDAVNLLGALAGALTAVLLSPLFL